jgi:hypothetical protein
MLKQRNDGRDILIIWTAPAVLFAGGISSFYVFLFTYVLLGFVLAWYYIAQKKQWLMAQTHREIMRLCGCCKAYHYTPELAVMYLEHRGWVFDDGWYHPTKQPGPKLLWRDAYLKEFDRLYEVVKEEHTNEQ